MPYKTVQECSVKLLVPQARIPEEGDVFYNPVMRFDRNISIAVASLLDKILEKSKETIRVCDLLAASGIRALRYSKEAGLDVTANDISPKAAELMRKNAKQNGASLEIVQKNANVLLATENFDFIDIDPFGSPVYFADAAAGSIPFRGFLAATATDLGPLMGAYPEVARRRYGLRSLDTDYNKELGLRILITAMQARFFAREKTFVPQFAYVRRHYFRIYGRVRYGNKNVNATLKDYGYVSHCFECGWRACTLAQTCPLCKKKTEFCGELYLGDIQNIDFCTEVSEELWKRGFSEEAAFVKSVGEEAQFPFYSNTHYVAEKLKTSSPRIESVIAKLQEEGFKATRTHFCGTAVKTNAGFDEVKKIIGKNIR